MVVWVAEKQAPAAARPMHSTFHGNTEITKSRFLLLKSLDPNCEGHVDRTASIVRWYLAAWTLLRVQELAARNMRSTLRPATSYAQNPSCSSSGFRPNTS
jgi:hypothetical protein